VKEKSLKIKHYFEKLAFGPEMVIEY